MKNLDTPMTFYREDYLAPNFTIDTVFLEFLLNPVKTIR
jgi:aminopeptidase N